MNEMLSVRQKRVSEPSKRRLVLLAEFLSRTDKARITSVELASFVHWSSALIRHDIASIGFCGGVSNGYDVRRLCDAILRFFEIAPASSEKKCCIVGLGRLGTALLDEAIFDGTGYKIVAGFDPNVNRTEILRSAFPLYPASRIEAVVASERIEYAILASKNEDAAPLASRLVSCGIRGIVNYTDAVLGSTVSARVENASPVTLLRTLSARVSGIAPDGGKKAEAENAAERICRIG